MILTNYRVQKVEREWGQSFSITIFLENISSIETKFKSDFWLLILAPFLVLGGFYAGGFVVADIATIAGFILGLLAIAFWWATRKRQLLISSNGGSPLNCELQVMSIDKINDLVQAVSLAKHTRVNKLYKV